jgi:hypothetical protein
MMASTSISSRAMLTAQFGRCSHETATITNGLMSKMSNNDRSDEVLTGDNVVGDRLTIQTDSNPPPGSYQQWDLQSRP